MAYRLKYISAISSVFSHKNLKTDRQTDSHTDRQKGHIFPKVEPIIGQIITKYFPFQKNPLFELSD